MYAMLEAIQEQNRLLTEQNAMLAQMANEQEAVLDPTQDTFSNCDMMTDHDLQLILNSPNIYKAIDRWNKRCDERAKRRLKR